MIAVTFSLKMRACEIKTVLDLGRQSASFRESELKKILLYYLLERQWLKSYLFLLVDRCIMECGPSVSTWPGNAWPPIFSLLGLGNGVGTGLGRIVFT